MVWRLSSSDVPVDDPILLVHSAFPVDRYDCLITDLRPDATGPAAQLKSMFTGHRALTVVTYLVCIILTLVVALHKGLRPTCTFG